MMKLIGSVLLISAGALWGAGRSFELRARVGLLSQLELLLQNLKTEISYSARPLPELIRTSDSPFCRAAAQRPEFSMDPCGALARAGEGLLGNEKDRELFRDFAAGLGTSDTGGQLEHLQLCMARARQHLSEARDICRERSRLYVGLGVLLGLGAWVLLL